jgi:hypothetical protein
MSLDRVQMVEQAWPYDGPHTAESVTDAAQAINALVRYLNNATGPVNATRSLKWAATTNRVVGGIKAAFYGFDQLLSQLANAMCQQVDDPTLYDERQDRAAGETAKQVATFLVQARKVVRPPCAYLEEASQLGSHLGNE